MYSPNCSLIRPNYNMQQRVCSRDEVWYSSYLKVLFGKCHESPLCVLLTDKGSGIKKGPDVRSTASSMNSSRDKEREIAGRMTGFAF